MTRKRNDQDNPEENRDENQELWPGDDGAREQPRGDEAPEVLAEAGADGAPDGAGDEARDDAALPTQDDLEARGFTPDEVQRLVIVSDRQAQSDESQVAEATLRRLRFTRWLIDHGMLDEWSA
ncbi:MAG TPA: hypothetical protein VIG30_14940 [Ktedonobacterales bacterium]|jgi:hypothetical protein